MYEAFDRQKWVFEPTGYDYYSGLGWSWVFANGQHTAISSGYRLSSRPEHYAIDLWDGTISNVQILSPTAGIVQRVLADHSSAGHYVVIKSNDKDDLQTNNIRVGFMHMVAGSSTLSELDQVSKGTVIGRVGSTGTNKAHLHLCMWNSSGDWVNENNSLNPQRFFPTITFTGKTSTVSP